MGGEQGRRWNPVAVEASGGEVVAPKRQGSHGRETLAGRSEEATVVMAVAVSSMKRSKTSGR